MFFDDYKKLGFRFKKRRWLSNLKAHFFARRQATVQTLIKPNTLLIVRVDRIGDYVLFRDFLRAIRHSERFQKYHITLCGNDAFRDIAENFDVDVVDDFIWLNRAVFMKNKYENFRFLHTIRKRGFETVFQPTFSRDRIGDMIVWASRAPRRIGVNGDFTNQSPEQRQKTDALYTELVDVAREPVFEFHRNKEVVEKIIGHSINIEKPTWPTAENNPIAEKNYAVLLVGAGHKRKRWNKFDEIAAYLFTRFGLKIIFVGHGRNDRLAVQQFVKKADFDFLNLCDQLSVSQVGRLCAHARLVLGNDSGIIHIAAIQQVPTICLSPGAHAYRFNRYPVSFNFKTMFLFPPELEAKKNSDEFKIHSSRYADSFDLSGISVERVKHAVEKMLAHG